MKKRRKQKQVQENFDRTLKLAIRDIKAILKKYDIGGDITLFSKGYDEYLIEFPSWSIAKFEKRDGQLGIRFNTMDGNWTSQEDKEKAIQATVGFLFALKEQGKRRQETGEEILHMLKDAFEFEHTRYQYQATVEEELQAIDPRSQPGWRPGFSLDEKEVP